MARKNKYTKLKPKVSPLTYILVGVVFIGLILTIILSIKTPKENFDTRFGLDSNNYQLIKTKQLEKKIDAGEELIVVIGFGKNTTTPATVLHELQVVYDVESDRYNATDRLNLPKVIYYVEMVDEEVFNNFVEKYEITLTSQDPLMLGFRDQALVSEFNGTKDHGAHAGNAELANLIRNMKAFFAEFNEEN